MSFIIVLTVYLIIFPFNSVKGFLTKSKKKNKQTQTDFFIKLIGLLDVGYNQIDALSMALGTKIKPQNLSSINSLKPFVARYFYNDLSEKQIQNVTQILHICFSNSIGLKITVTLKSLLKTLEAMQKLQNKLKTSTSAAKTTIKVLNFLPVFALSISFVLGVNVFDVMFDGKIGTICFICGMCFYFTGLFITNRMISAVTKGIEGI